MPPRTIHQLTTGEAKLWLLLVGVSQYQDPSLSPLPYAIADCRELAQAFRNATRNFPETVEYVYYDPIHSNPTLEAILHALQEIVAEAQPQDTSIFCFCGHGQLNSATDEVMLCLADTQSDRLETTGLSLSKLLDYFSQCQALQQVIVLDACHSGAIFLPGSLTTTLQQRKPQNKAFYALLSCDRNQKSLESFDLGHGAFSYYLIEGLKGKAANDQGEIDIAKLYDYIYHGTQQYIHQANQQKRLINQQRSLQQENQLEREYPLQTPKIISERIGDPLILGLTQTEGTSQTIRNALIIEGLSAGKTTLDIYRLLSQRGGFNCYHWHRDNQNLPNLKAAIAQCLNIGKASAEGSVQSTALLYLRGHLQSATDDREACLLLNSGEVIRQSWLRQQLLASPIPQQIIILEAADAQSLQEWLAELRLPSKAGQCIIMGVSPSSQPEHFSQKLLECLQTSESLSVAQLISYLQQSLGIQFYPWLSRFQGVIEVLLGGKNTVQNLDVKRCPYKGLDAFTEHDEIFYYGRELLTQQLIAEISQTSFLAVIGASGSGKSSLVQAGLIANLRQGKYIPGSEDWQIQSLRPGQHPLEELAKLLPQSQSLEDIEELLSLGRGKVFFDWLYSSSETILLVVDQFEELFTLTEPFERNRFLNILLQALDEISERFKLVITLRADFIPACLEIRPLYKRLQKSSVLVPETLDDYRSVIVEPARKVGLSVETDLVNELLKSLQDAPGNLPILEFVLEQLWYQRKEGQLLFETYREVLGGFTGVLNRKAEEVYQSLDSTAQECARWIFLKLIKLGEGTEDTRKRIIKEDLFGYKYSKNLINNTLLLLSESRLIVMGNQDSKEVEINDSKVPVEVAHEIIIRSWDTLRWWLDESRTRLSKIEQIEKQAKDWGKHIKTLGLIEEKTKNKEKQESQRGYLLTNGKLREALEIYTEYQDELSLNDKIYIERSLEFQDKEKKEAQKRKRLLIGGIIGASGLIISAGTIAWFQKQQTQKEQLLRYASSQIITPENSQAILEILPNYLQGAEQARRENKTKEALEDYREILLLSHNLEQALQEKPSQFPKLLPKKGQIRLIFSKAELSLADLIEKGHLNQLEIELSKGNFGRLVEANFALLDKQYTGALSVTDALIMRPVGAHADRNNDGKLDEGEEALIPCQTLKEIEALWRKYTQNRCYWYGVGESNIFAPQCHELDQKSLMAAIVYPVAFPQIEQRLKECKISPTR